MFDNKFSEMYMGELMSVGWPWHGLASGESGGPIQLTLPNNVTIPLKATMREATSPIYHQQGAAVKFRDGRAKEVERTPEQLAEDAAKGIEWRPEVLYNPNEGVLFGESPAFRRAPSWLYYDGERSWRARLSGDWIVRLEELPIGLRNPDIKQISLGSSTNLSSYTVVDITEDGSKVLLCRYTKFSNGGNIQPNDLDYCYKSKEFDPAAGGAWWSVPADYVELELSRSSSGLFYFANVTTIATFNDTKPVQLPSIYEETKNQAKGTVKTSGYPYSGDSFDAAITVGVDIEGLHYTPYDSPNLRRVKHEWEDRIVGMFYRDDGTIGTVTVHNVIEEQWRYSPPDFLAGAAIYDFVFDEEAHAITPLYFAGPWHQIGGMITAQGWIEAVQTVKIDGEIVSTMTAREETEASSMLHGRYRIEAQTNGGALSEFTSSIAMELEQDPITPTREFWVDCNGVEIVRKSRVDENATMRWIYQRWTPSGDDTRVFAWHGPVEHGDVTLNLCRYAPTVFVHTLTALNYYNAWEGEAVQVTGDAIVPKAPKDQRVIQGEGENPWPFRALNGSYNPITGELARDYPTPVFWM